MKSETQVPTQPGFSNTGNQVYLLPQDRTLNQEQSCLREKTWYLASHSVSQSPLNGQQMIFKTYLENERQRPTVRSGI